MTMAVSCGKLVGTVGIICKFFLNFSVTLLISTVLNVRRPSRSRLSMNYGDEPIVASGGVDDSYMAEDLDDTRTGEMFNASIVYGGGGGN